MPAGADVCAARAGVVTRVVDHHDGNGPGMPNNLIFIAHDDGTLGWYLHILKGGAHVREGDLVRRGQVIAACGNVGNSMLPHVHFQVSDRGGRSIPVTFADVPGDGVPRMFRRYTSGNEPEE
jgi:murein DD-endopeptidase MepM/ murein hydrolase activator NlpD